MSKYPGIIFCSFAVIFSTVAYLALYDKGLIMDEKHHFAQIGFFREGSFKIYSFIAMIPGYHFFQGALSYLTGYSSLNYLRFVNLILGFLCSCSFYMGALKLNRRSALKKTAQFFFFPVILPFYFLIYTDILSLLLILTCLTLALYRSFFLSSLLGLLAVLTRQNNIIWIIFVYLFIYTYEFKYVFSLENFKSYVTRKWMYALPLTGLLVFFIINDYSLILGDQSAHPLSFQMGNVYFFLFTTLCMYAVLIFSSLKETVFKSLLNRKFLAGITVFVCFFYFTFANEHIYNQIPVFVRNKILLAIDRDYFLRALYAIAMVIGLGWLGRVMYYDRAQRLIYPLTFLSLLPLWVIEHRYYFIPLTLIQLFRIPGNEKMENLFLWFNILLSAIILSALSTKTFIL